MSGPGGTLPLGEATVARYTIRTRRGRVVLPATEHSVPVYSWTDSEANAAAFAARARSGEPDACAPVTASAVLVNHERNDYNPNAISVSTPSVGGGTLDSRHLGYLPEYYLNKVGQAHLPMLIDHAGGEVDVTVIVFGGEELGVAIPSGTKLGKAIRRFLAPHGLETGRPPRDYVPEPVRHPQSVTAPQTEHTLAALALFPHAPTPPESVVLRTKGDLLLLHDAQDGRRVGELREGLLLLNDERDREQVLALLAAAGVPAPGPVTRPAIAETGDWPAGAVPNAQPYPRLGRIDLNAANADGSPAAESFAVLSPGRGVLWVEDSRLVDVALRTVHRLGLDPGRIGLPYRPWNLDREVGYKALRDDGVHFQPWTGHRLKVLESFRAAVPEGTFVDEEVSWASDPPAPPEATTWVELLEQYTQGRAHLFPGHDLTGRMRGCRLCGLPAAAFTTSVCTDPVAYCRVCLDAADTGLVKDRARSALALKALSDLEFGGEAVLAEELRTVGHGAPRPLPPDLLDQMVLLRFAVPRTGMPWTLLLAEAGLLPEGGLRTSRGTVVTAIDGHRCTSLGEKAVCDFLHRRGIRHEREPLYPLDPELNPRRRRRADWVLGDGTLVELWGMPNDPAYAAKMAQKRDLAARHSLRLVELMPADLPGMADVFAEWEHRDSDKRTTSAGSSRMSWGP